MGEQLKFRGELVAHEDWVTSIAATSEASFMQCDFPDSLESSHMWLCHTLSGLFCVDGNSCKLFVLQATSAPTIV